MYREAVAASKPRAPDSIAVFGQRPGLLRPRAMYPQQGHRLFTKGRPANCRNGERRRRELAGQDLADAERGRPAAQASGRADHVA